MSGRNFDSDLLREIFFPSWFRWLRISLTSKKITNLFVLSERHINYNLILIIFLFMISFGSVRSLVRLRCETKSRAIDSLRARYFSDGLTRFDFFHFVPPHGARNTRLLNCSREENARNDFIFKCICYMRFGFTIESATIVITYWAFTRKYAPTVYYVRV